MTEEQEIRAKALELALLSFATKYDPVFERYKDDNLIPSAIRQRAKIIEEYIKNPSP